MDVAVTATTATQWASRPWAARIISFVVSYACYARTARGVVWFRLRRTVFCAVVVFSCDELFFCAVVGYYLHATACCFPSFTLVGLAGLAASWGALWPWPFPYFLSRSSCVDVFTACFVGPGGPLRRFFPDSVSSCVRRQDCPQPCDGVLCAVV